MRRLRDAWRSRRLFRALAAAGYTRIIVGADLNHYDKGV
jgi:hypothetical protein